MLTGCCCVLTVVIAMAQTGPSDPIIGKWKSVEETEGWNFILEFGHDGSHRMTMLMENSGTYSIIGRQIRSQSKKQSTETEEFRIDDDVLFLETTEKSLETPEKETRLKRFGAVKDPASPIIGKWRDTGKFKDGKGYEIVMEYNGNGRFESSISLEPQTGSYRISGNSLTTTLDGVSSTTTFQIKADTLIMVEGTSRTKFRKILSGTLPRVHRVN